MQLSSAHLIVNHQPSCSLTSPKNFPFYRASPRFNFGDCSSSEIEIRSPDSLLCTSSLAWFIASFFLRSAGYLVPAELLFLPFHQSTLGTPYRTELWCGPLAHTCSPISGPSGSFSVWCLSIRTYRPGWTRSFAFGDSPSNGAERPPQKKLTGGPGLLPESPDLIGLRTTYYNILLPTSWRLFFSQSPLSRLLLHTLRSDLR